MLEEYKAPSIINFFQATPRFGHPSDVGALFTGESSAQDYGLGLIFIPVVLCSIYLIWNLLLVAFKCFCSKSIIGGGHLRINERYTVKNNIYRGIIFVSTISIIVLAVLTYVPLSSSLKLSFDSITNTVDELKDIVENISNTADAIVDAQGNFEDSRIISIHSLENGICGDTSKETPIDDDINSIVQVMRDMGRWSYKYERALVSVQNTLHTAEKVLSHDTFDMITIVGEYSVIAWIAITMLISASFIFIGSMFALMRPQFKMVSCTMGWVVLPLFIICVTLSVFLACLCGIIIVFNSDVCIGSASGDPEGFFKTIVNYEELSDNPKDMLDYYIFDACNDTIDALDDINAQLDQTSLYHKDLVSTLEMFTPETQSQIELLCANDISLDESISSLTTFINRTATLIPLAQNAQDAVNCPIVNELYRNLSHDVICTQIPITIGWIFWTVILYVTFGMIVYTLRGAVFPAMIDDDEEEEPFDVGLKEDEKAYVNDEGDIVIPLKADTYEDHDTSKRHNYYSKDGHDDRALMMLELENTFSHSTQTSSPKYYATV